MAEATKRRILNFHGIGTPRRALEPGEADFWLREERFLLILDKIANHPDRDRLSITFDDGNTSDLSIAAPALLDRGLRAEFFVLTGRIGETGSLDSDDIRALMQMGMSIGSHGVAHRDWSTLPTIDLQYELTASKATLEEICKITIGSAAIPFGRYNAAVLKALRSAGYSTAYSSDGGSAEPLTYLRPRSSLRHSTTDDALENVVSGRMPPLKRLRRFAGMSARAWL
ncbi:polysaccharide deacetylase family protein [Rhizobiaceae bacterium n13]|uniref:Chitooligosaccharide deacetylase n=1 Tax=Ferirhizobium litorale TaxID=2927786 RepID=A0AAE3QBL4_9HYPH|nr:polysaccharide deacetylase family protein [Fererhizobium litorale]MDI7860732.1 polysaccharide deacetylase family protein [Fererhizobium litorale]MDI7920880.1 polysaccharide deacetylase family protein [Fererhizobium litorale]